MYYNSRPKHFDYIHLSLFQRLSSTAPLPANECFAKLTTTTVQLLFWDDKPLPKIASNRLARLLPALNDWALGGRSRAKRLFIIR